MRLFAFHIAGAGCWVCVLLKLFVFDIDLFLVGIYAPILLPAVTYRLFFILFLISCLWYLLGDQEFLKLSLFTLFYPLILFFWCVPKWLLTRKKWFLMFTYLSGITSALADFKTNLVLFTMSGVGVAVIVSGSTPLMHYFAGILLVAITVFLLGKRIYFAFSPSSIFTIDTKSIVRWLEEKDLSADLMQDVSRVTEKRDTDYSIESVPAKLPILVLLNRVLCFISDKLTHFKESRVYVAFFILSLLFTFAMSSVLYGFVNYGLFKLNPSAFDIQGPVSLLLFWYYSLNALIINAISAVQPQSVMATVIYIVQILYGMILIVVLVGILISVNTQKYREDIDEVICAFNSQSKHVERAIHTHFRMSIQQALDKLERTRHGLMELIRYIDLER